MLESSGEHLCLIENKTKQATVWVPAETLFRQARSSRIRTKRNTGFQLEKQIQPRPECCLREKANEEGKRTPLSCKTNPQTNFSLMRDYRYLFSTESKKLFPKLRATLD